MHLVCTLLRKLRRLSKQKLPEILRGMLYSVINYLINCQNNQSELVWWRSCRMFRSTVWCDLLQSPCFLGQCPRIVQTILWCCSCELFALGFLFAPWKNGCVPLHIIDYPTHLILREWAGCVTLAHQAAKDHCCCFKYSLLWRDMVVISLKTFIVNNVSTMRMLPGICVKQGPFDKLPCRSGRFSHLWSWHGHLGPFGTTKIKGSDVLWAFYSSGTFLLLRLIPQKVQCHQNS